MNQTEITERLGWYSCPPRYLHCRFENFDGYTTDLAERLDLARRAADRAKSVVFFGSVGCGKTHLAVATMASWAARGISGKFVGAADFVYRIQTGYGNANSVLSGLLDESDRFVLIDDLGAEKSTDSARAALLYLIDHAYREKLKLIVTSNLTPAQLNQYEPRLMSRLSEMALLVAMKGKDFRVSFAVRAKKALSHR